MYKFNNTHRSDEKKQPRRDQGIHADFYEINKRFNDEYKALENEYRRIEKEFDEVKQEKFESALNELISQYVEQAKLVHCLSEEYEGEKVCFDDAMKELGQCSMLLNKIKNNQESYSNSKNNIVSLQAACSQACNKLNRIIGQDEEASQEAYCQELEKLNKETSKFSLKKEIEEFNNKFEKIEKFNKSLQDLSKKFEELKKNYLTLNNKLVEELKEKPEQSKNELLEEVNLHELDQYGIKNPKKFELNKRYSSLLNSCTKKENVNLSGFNIKNLLFTYPLNKFTLSSDQIVFLTEQDAKEGRILFEKEIVCSDPSNLLPEEIKQAFEPDHYPMFIARILGLGQRKTIDSISDESISNAIKFDVEGSVFLLIGYFGLHNVLRKLSQSNCLSLEQGQALSKLFSDLIEPRRVNWKYPVSGIILCVFCLTAFNIPYACKAYLKDSTLFGMDAEYLIYLVSYAFLFFHLLDYAYSLLCSLYEYFILPNTSGPVFEELKQLVQQRATKEELSDSQKFVVALKEKFPLNDNEEKVKPNDNGISATLSNFFTRISSYLTLTSESNGNKNSKSTFQPRITSG
jgi:hypothetical protein